MIAGLKRITIPVIKATEESVKGYGCLVKDPATFDIEITRWPSQGWRPVDTDSGNEGGTKEGIFFSEWKGDILYGSNEAVGGKYILGYNTEPATASDTAEVVPEKILLWHSNYHPDGGQLFFPLDKKPYLVPVALPGDDIHPEHFICFLCDSNQGLYIHPNIWHEGVFAINGKQRFLDKQGAVHARVSVDFAREFQYLLQISLEDINV
ncbi:MAG: ureidoglycolate lyase [Bacteroidota bacterium]|nr:ureidoglycolate lyase [Bacteroidota bacterium]